MLIVLIILYLIIGYFTFRIFPWTNHPFWEKIALSISWPCIMPLQIIHWIHNKF